MPITPEQIEAGMTRDEAKALLIEAMGTGFTPTCKTGGCEYGKQMALTSSLGLRVLERVRQALEKDAS